ncbi:hypothetical protein ENUP19_0371G0027 [Entamoeba nuttalli]|uniref:non-specific serine/threonine protein kinase n=2 Tax=Entamoeba nuttalli TaxID=412467 RepID=K2HB22_ENTNP|nr:protein kinase, putative [Entamoeba nuttalli P19]EKE39874.1 protein kinase, putative [Entamoeba nuttalli P19]|eukprot:XP_008857791.1 protein kinase, putative [Entamoeba nuttalli P19]
MGNTQIQLGNQSILIERELGSGGFGKLYLAHPQTNLSINYALKTQSFFDQQRLDQIKKEIAIQKKCCQCEFVCQLYLSAAFSNPRKEVLMLMEYCPSSLVQILEKSYPKGLQESIVLGIFYQIANAISFLHSQNPPIVHRDIKIENILFSSTRKFKLIDFGSATFEPELLRKQGDCGTIEEEVNKMTTPEYRAPELINVYEYLPIGCKSDVWAFGCLIYKCLTLHTPFEDSPMKILAVKYDLPNCSPLLQTLFKMIFIRNPVQRADIFQVLGFITDATKLPNPYISFRKPFQLYYNQNVQQPQQQHIKDDIKIQKQSCHQNSQQNEVKHKGDNIKVSGTKTSIISNQQNTSEPSKKTHVEINENTINICGKLAKGLPRSPRIANTHSSKLPKETPKTNESHQSYDFGTFNFNEPVKVCIPRQKQETSQSFEFKDKCSFDEVDQDKKQLHTNHDSHQQSLKVSKTKQPHLSSEQTNQLSPSLFNFNSTTPSYIPQAKVVHQTTSNSSFDFGQSSFNSTQSQKKEFNSFNFDSQPMTSIPSPMPKQRISSTFVF